MNKQKIENEIIRQEAGEQSKSTQLTDQQLDAVVGGTKNASGGKLFEAVTKGTHIPTVSVEC